MVEHAVQGVVESQDALGAGYVGGQVERGALELGGAWVPWYNLHKLSADLLDAHRHSRSDLALTA